MFYLLNHNDHTFSAHEFPELVSRRLEELKRQHVPDDCLEVVLAGDEERLGSQEFQDKWS